MTNPSVLICTVGTGNIDQLSETLLEPFKKSICKGQWDRVILVPSQLTKENATKLRDEAREVPIDIRELPERGAEEDADACYEHFDRILHDLRNQGLRPEALLVDFTRGTKAMSAALVLAAIRHDLPKLRYVSGGSRDERGMVVPGTEIVAEVRTTIATAQKRFDDAFRFFRHGNFAAVLATMPDAGQLSALGWPHQLSTLANTVRTLADFYAAWDRLDYKGAQKVPLSACDNVTAPWDAMLPSPEVCHWVATLAQPLPEAYTERAAALRNLVVDLLANGERRLRDHQHEDAVIRGYRVLELIGQIRLFDHGLDSASLPPEHPVVKEFQAKLLKKKKSEPLTEKDGKLQAPREKVARLLKRLGDPLANDLLRLGNREEGVVKLSKRNYSIWIHGFEAIAGSNPEPIRYLLNELEKLLVQDGGQKTSERLQWARRLDLSQRT